VANEESGEPAGTEAMASVPVGPTANSPSQLISQQSMQAGTSGTATCTQLTGTTKTSSCYLNGYAETGSAQTFTFPIPYQTAPVLLESGGSCGTYNPTTSATVLTLPANAAMTAETWNIVLIGQ